MGNRRVSSATSPRTFASTATFPDSPLCAKPSRTSTIIRPTSDEAGGAAATVNAFTKDGLFIGQSKAFFELLADLASDPRRPEDLPEYVAALTARRARLTGIGVGSLVGAARQMREDSAEARRVLRLLEALDDHDDVQNVWSNFDMPDEVLAAAAE